MADMEDELRVVKEELSLVECQLASLLEHQQQLLAKKRHLEESLRADTASVANSLHQWDNEDFPWSMKLSSARETVFKLRSYRPLQLQTMNASLSGKDVMLIMPTGGGKSLCFQLPAVVSKGVTLVVSPLVSLMEDQTMALKELSGIKAHMLNAASSKEDVKSIQDAMTNENVIMHLLYVTPEKLAKSKRFMSKLEKMYSMGRLARLVIDEVHCCSQWGHDFRPDYKFLGIMKRQFPRTPILGLTATATANVLEDVKKILQIPRCVVFRASFNRSNLFYEVHSKPSSSKDMVELLVNTIQKRFDGESGIVYCLTQRDAEDVSSKLQSCGIQAGCYHANLSPAYRSRIHRSWISGAVQVVVATIAFGMGIDTPDVRFVIHHSLSKSMENYYQESGRAGRDDKQAYCILYSGFSDVFRQSTMVMSEQTGIDNLYGMLRYAYDPAKCRRSLIAQFFGERWESSDCNQMCDHCQKQVGTMKKEITSYCSDLLTILTEAKSKKQQLTALKLIDSWLGKGSTALRVNTVKPPAGLDRSDAERVIVHVLTQGYLKEEYHFTPYTTISYLVPGPRSSLLQNNDHKIFINWPSNAQQQSQKSTTSQPKSTTSQPKSTTSQSKSTTSQSKSTTSQSKSTSSLSKSSSKKSKSKTTDSHTELKSSKTKPVFVNAVSSHFLSNGVSGGLTVSDSSHHSESQPGDVKPKKRPKPVIIEDSDSDLDFCEFDSDMPSKKAKLLSEDRTIVNVDAT